MLEEVIIGEKRYLLVGTAHVSKRSKEEVEALVCVLRSDNVAIELCKDRMERIKGDNQMDDMDLGAIIKSGQGTMLMANFLLSSYQKRIGEQLGVRPGDEMRAGISMGEKLSIPISPIDRPINITLKRILRKMSFWEKIKGIGGLISSAFAGDDDKEEVSEEMVEALKHSPQDSLEMLGEEFPGIRKYLLDERDMYMAYKLQRVPGKEILAVMGAAHFEGVKKHLIAGDVTKADMDEISELPKKKHTASFIALGILIVFLAILSVIFFKNPLAGVENIVWWLILTCGLGGLGALIAGGHPVTILASIVGAPIGAALPFLSTGMISGFVEAKMRKPKGKDFNNLQTDIFKISRWWKNGILRIFLVFLLSSIGAAIGNIIGLSSILGSFFNSI